MHLKMGVVIMFGAARAKTEVSVDQAMGLRQKFGSGSGVWLDSQWDSASPGVTDSKQGTTFNCGRAVAERESDYACIDSNSCTMTPDELTEMKNREADIDQYCNLGFNPLPDIFLN